MSAHVGWRTACVVGGKADALRGADAAAELAAGLGDAPGTVILFVSPEMEPESLVTALAAAMPRARIYGASASGVVGRGTIAGVGASAILIPAAELEVRSLRFSLPKRQLGWNEVATRLNALERSLGLHQLLQPGKEGFVLLFSAGLRESEEYVTSRLHLVLPDLPLVGGTASDGMRFEETFVIADGEIHTNSNLVLLGRAHRPFRTFQHHHFTPSERQFVVTEQGSSPRVVRTLDGRPARAAYAKALGVDDPADLTVPGTSKWPFGVRVQDRWYIRSVYRIDDDELVFACSLEEGSVLTLMHAGDIVQTLHDWMDAAPAPVGAIWFNCLGRYLEMEADEVLPAVARQLGGLPAAGMNTYGEQYMGLHLNHTLTGIAFE